MRLFPRLLLSFLAVAAVAVGVVSWAAGQAASSEMRGYMDQGGLAQALAGFYQGRGSWAGVESLLAGEHRGHGGMMAPAVIVADAAGRVVAGPLGQGLGERLDAAALAGGTPIMADGQAVGTLLTHGGPGSLMGEAVLARVHRAIGLAAAAAAAAALAIGGGLAYGLARPVRRLTAASRAVARGDLSQRVPAGGRDEIGDLAAAFNAMAAGLERAEALRRDLVADVAHELRNPLAVLRGSLEALVDGVLPPTPDNLQPLLAQTQVLARLVDDLRTLALADAGQLTLRRAPASPRDLAETLAAQFAAQAAGGQVELTAAAAADLPATVRMDGERIAQVLANLLANALANTPAGGAVTLECAPSSGAVRFSVTDSGSGIPAESLPHIFERFYRVDRGQPRADGGTGLGLAIARQLVEAHGGRIWAESRPGRGARVTFELPAG